MGISFSSDSTSRRQNVGILEEWNDGREEIEVLE
jgi:hypothetical protein